MNRRYTLALAMTFAASACTQQPAPPVTTPEAVAVSEPAPVAAPEPAPPANPFFTASTLPFQAPAFDRFEEAHYQPAIEEGMKQQLREMDAIASQSAAPTFANTLEAMERSGELLTRVSKVFFSQTGANTNPNIQKIEAEVSPKFAAHQDEIYLNPRLFARVKSLHDQRTSLGLDAQAMYLVERYYLNFVRAGALLSEADKTTLRAINQEESKLSTEFSERVLADTNASALVIDDVKELDGLSEGDIAAAAGRAKDRGLEGKWVLSLQNTTQQPAMTFLKNRSVRQRLLKASMSRGNHGGENDTRQMIARLAQLRAQRAKLLGYRTYAEFALQTRMAGSTEKALGLLSGLVPAATAQVRADAAKMQKLIDKEKGGFKLGPEDWQYYAEKVRKAEFDLDEAQVRPYLELDRVLVDGVFFSANKLYGLTFRERMDLPVYHPDVRVWDVFDADGSQLAIYYGDFFARPSKSGGAWMDSFVDQSGLMGTKPVIFNVTNFTKPAQGKPALLSFGEAETLFHEFGHSLHGMLSNVRYPTLAGTNVPRDFVEFPSSFNEHWALEPTVFANYAKHHETGAPMPKTLVDRIRKSSTFNQGYGTTEYLSSALLDLAWHDLPADAPLQDVDAFEKEALKKAKIDLAQVPPRYRTPYFSHIWGGGYSAGYYAYLWSELIDQDAFAWFKENGGMTRENGQRFRDMILSRGNMEDNAAMYRTFRGRDPIVDPLLEARGLKPPKK